MVGRFHSRKRGRKGRSGRFRFRKNKRYGATYRNTNRFGGLNVNRGLITRVNPYRGSRKLIPWAKDILAARTKEFYRHGPETSRGTAHRWSTSMNPNATKHPDHRYRSGWDFTPWGGLKDQFHNMRMFTHEFDWFNDKDRDYLQQTGHDWQSWNDARKLNQGLRDRQDNAPAVKRQKRDEL